mmetsp:Transcript_137811/g.358042  ORF Transcript_137811/g.358042 Transcript_137811/m.358042 type:complete len:191 (-) Transcript_137811:209-781(-)
MVHYAEAMRNTIHIRNRTSALIYCIKAIKLYLVHTPHSSIWQWSHWGLCCKGKIDMHPMFTMQEQQLHSCRSCTCAANNTWNRYQVFSCTIHACRASQHIGGSTPFQRYHLCKTGTCAASNVWIRGEAASRKPHACKVSPHTGGNIPLQHHRSRKSGTCAASNTWIPDQAISCTIHSCRGSQCNRCSSLL